MHLFLHIIISEKSPGINFGLSNWIKDNLPNTTYYSLDNHSEPLVIETGVKALNEAEDAFIFIECEDEDPAKIFRIIKEASKLKKTIELEIFCKGRNQKLEVIAKMFGDKWISTGDAKEISTSFFKDQA